MPDFPFRRNTTIEPVVLPATDVASKTTVPDLRQVQGVMSFGVDNAYPIHIRLVGTGYGAAQFNAAAEGKGWIFGPGKHGPFSTQFPEFMSAIAVDRPGYPIKDASGALLYPAAALEVFYGSGNGGWGGAGVPFVMVRNFPAAQPVNGTVNVGNFPATQQVGDNGGSITVDTGTVGQFAVTVSGTPTVNIGTAPVITVMETASLTVDTGTPGVFALTPSPLAANSIAPVRNSGSASLVLKGAPGNMYSAYSVASTTGYILMALDRTTAPAAGAAINLSTDVISLIQVPANGAGSISPPDIPDRFINGCTLIATTSLTSFTAPNPLPLFMRGKVA